MTIYYTPQVSQETLGSALPPYSTLPAPNEINYSPIGSENSELDEQPPPSYYDNFAEIGSRGRDSSSSSSMASEYHTAPSFFSSLSSLTQETSQSSNKILSHTAPSIAELSPTSETITPWEGTSSPFQLSSLLTRETSPSDNARINYMPPLNVELPTTTEIITSWDEIMLLDTRKLPNLTFENDKISKAIDVKVYFTKDMGEMGIPPKMVDPNTHEFKQGDMVNGYVRIRNLSSRPIPFSLFHIIFEGSLMIKNAESSNNKMPLKEWKFVQMVDSSGSWSSKSEHSRFKTALDLPAYSRHQEEVVDPVDGSFLNFGVGGALRCDRSYKRFFSFKIPESLMDLQCNNHDLIQHFILPPTFGSSRMGIAREYGLMKNRNEDFSDYTESVSYAVTARFVAKNSKWENDFKKFTNSNNRSGVGSLDSARRENSEYIILKEVANYIRLVPTTNPLSEYERNFQMCRNVKVYNHFIKRINNWIEWGKELQLCSQVSDSLDDEIPPVDLLEGEETTGDEIGQEFTRDFNARKNSTRWFEVNYSMVKKSSLFGRNERRSLINIKTPRQEYHVSYIPPARFRSGNIAKTFQSTKLDIPIYVSVENNGNLLKQMPPLEIKNIWVELEVFKITSEKNPIPIEFEHAFLSNGKPTDIEESFIINTIETTVVQPMKNHAKELSQMVDQLRPELFTIDKKLIGDVKTLSCLKVKTTKLLFDNLIVNGKVYSQKEKLLISNNSYNASTKKLNLSLDLKNLLKKNEVYNRVSYSGDGNNSFDRFTLLPSFQSCYFARMYDIKVSLVVNDRVMVIKVPVVIEHRSTFKPIPYSITLSTC
ncbi:hypothetical protein CORT_0F01980 [Candida orthopsilosis Co 90-125]|uniref:Uncharacterized protein n=1 Tax=Candida orthopsilosis (strain 90-125) TaxID=1136231 RepID=H8X8F0_CANO9|nr:hypothetical protein CORT_0F01980 [Candida orthopsilosis Co 90-125]CCG24425.1 hypothetical protein CORT_0F01980 [Candida orthopsilosis Co 90-125]